MRFPLLLLLLLTAAAANAKIAGTVVRDDGMPIAGARIVAYPPESLPA